MSSPRCTPPGCKGLSQMSSIVSDHRRGGQVKAVAAYMPYLGQIHSRYKYGFHDYYTARTDAISSRFITQVPLNAPCRGIENARSRDPRSAPVQYPASMGRASGLRSRSLTHACARLVSVEAQQPMTGPNPRATAGIRRCRLLLGHGAPCGHRRRRRQARAGKAPPRDPDRLVEDIFVVDIELTLQFPASERRGRGHDEHVRAERSCRLEGEG